MPLTSTWWINILLILITVTFLFYKYSSRKYDYWKKRGIYYKEPVPFIGSVFPILTFQTSIGQWLRDLYNSTNEPYFGIFIFDEPYLILKSPDIIKNVLVKDFNYFYDRTILSPKHDKIMENMMFFQRNPEWKFERTKMTPLFTSGKLKAMFSLISDTALELNKYIRQHLGRNVESKEICAKFSTDVIAKCAFAINSRCFEDEDAEFRKVGRSIFDFTWKNAISQSSFLYVHRLAKLFHLSFIPQSSSRYLKEIFWQAINLREKTNTKGNDLIDLLVDIRKDKDLCKQIKFEGDKVVAPAVQFFTAGFETTSSTIAFTLYELCIQPTVQDKLRNEIVNSIKEHGGITYDGLQEIKYLDMCIKETLRKYPVLPFLDRRCNAEYKVPGTDLVIEKGMPVYIPMLGLHYDEKYYPEPEKYIPERFGDKSALNSDGLNYIPFGDGPRSCIGERFGMLGARVGLASIISEFVVERNADTPVPVVLEPKSFALASTVGLPMTFSKFCPAPA